MRMAAFSMMRKDEDRSMCISTSDRSLRRSRNLLSSSGEEVSRLEETMDSNNAAAETITVRVSARDRDRARGLIYVGTRTRGVSCQTIIDRVRARVRARARGLIYVGTRTIKGGHLPRRSRANWGKRSSLLRPMVPCRT